MFFLEDLELIQPMVSCGPKHKKHQEHRPQGSHDFRLSSELPQLRGYHILASIHWDLLVLVKITLLVLGQQRQRTQREGARAE